MELFELFNELLSVISIFEVIDCEFTELYFQINKKAFKQKELIKILEKCYFYPSNESYVLSYLQLHDIIKPQIENEILQKKLIKSRFEKNRIINNKAKKLFL